MARIKLPKKKDYLTLRRWLLEYKHLSVDDIARLSGISISKIREWMVYCDVVNPKNGELFRVWVNYKNYSTAEACVVLGVTKKVFTNALNKYKIDKYRCKPRRPKPEPTIQLPRTEEGFKKLLNKYGIIKISQMSGLSTQFVKRIRDRHGLVSPRIKFIATNNKCNDAGWLREYYINRKLSLRKCAKIANVAPNTIRNWLINYGMVPRVKNGKNAILQAGIP